MTLSKRPNSPYWYYEFVIKGVRYTASTRIADKEAAKRIESQARLDAVTPVNTRPALTLDDAAVIYAERASTLPSWKDARRWLRAMLATIGSNRTLAEITQRDLMQAVAKRRVGRSNASVNREIEVWRAVWHSANAQRYDVGDMPTWGKLMLPVAAKPARTLSPIEEAALFTHLRADLHDFAAFALASGWRLSEVIRLTWRDVDLQARTASTRIKGGDTIIRPLSAAMLALVASQPRVGPMVFTYVAQANRAKHTATDGRKRAARQKGERYPLSVSGWRKPWAAALAAEGIDGLRFHDLRHTRGTRILRATGNLVLAGRALGHRSLKTTARYAHVLDEDLRAGMDAAEDLAGNNADTAARNNRL